MYHTEPIIVNLKWKNFATKRRIHKRAKIPFKLCVSGRTNIKFHMKYVKTLKGLASYGNNVYIRSLH